MSYHDWQELEKLTTPRLTKYIPHSPSPKQAAFLLLENLEGFYGGAAGGGKSDALLMAALQYVDIPGYRALLLRRTFQDLALPGALMDRAKMWLLPYVYRREVKWVEKEKTYVFPNGATLTFGYLEHENDKYRYQSAEFQYIGFDELTQFTMTQYTYMFSRLRKLKGQNIPLRMRSASNPDGPGLEWVKQRFVIEGALKGRTFIPAKLEDNPHLDQEEYERSLEELDPITRARLRHGNWDIKGEGKLFKREWFRVIDPETVPERLRIVRYWDFAATDPTRSKSKDPDWTVGLKLGMLNGIYYILHVIRFRRTPEATEQIVKQTAQLDGYNVNIFAEEEPGSSGKMLIDHYARNILWGYAFNGNRETGSKVLRANPASSAAERGNMFLVQAPWNSAFLDEAEVFPTKGMHDDQIDALSGAFRMLKTRVFEDALPIGVGDEASYWSSLNAEVL
ncbi:MAG: phage terminase large subunit [Sphaerochaetaceae bacterium]